MLSELVDVCSVPQLNQDIEDHPIDRSQFMEFTEILAINLPVLLDLLSNQEFILELSSEDDSDNVLMRQRLVMLMCEHAPVIPGHTPPYSVDNPELWINLKRICLSSEIASRSVLVDCLASYKERLLNSKWKRDLGSAHGFVYFCDVYLSSGDNPMDLQTILFILSIASQFIDCIHAEVKLLGLRLYAVILVRCPREMVLDTNVHKVVIKSCLDNCQKLIPDECLLLLWDDVVEAVCLDQAMLEDLNWNELDDCLHLLFQRIKLEGKREMRAKLRSKLQRIIVKCYGPGGEEILKDEDMLSVQQKIIGRQNVKLFRWIVDLKELFIFECLSVSNCADSTEEALRVSLDFVFSSRPHEV